MSDVVLGESLVLLARESRISPLTMTEVENSSQLQDQLDSVLGNLYDFGDDFVNPEDDIPEHGQINATSKEKKAETGHGCVEDQQPAVCSKRGKKNVSMFFNSIKDELCSAKNPAVSSSSASKPVEVVTFVSRKDKNIQDMNTEENLDEMGEDNGVTFDLEKVRLEVHQFGIKGYGKDKQRKFEQERVIMLGAKPPKKEYVNYKLYQEKLIKENQARVEKIKKENGMKPVKKRQGMNDRKKKGVVKAPSGQVGKFKNGALFLSRRDVVKIKRSKFIK